MNDERVDLLLAIARRALDIHGFARTGDRNVDFREFGVEEIGRALEAAYDAGLLVGYRIGRAEGHARP